MPEAPSRDIAERSSHTEATGWTPLAFDMERYQAMLDESDMTNAQKRELLEALWTIVVAFVDLGFRVHPIQQVPDMEDCLSGLLASTFGDVLSSETKIPENQASKPVDHQNGRAAMRES